MAQVSFTLIQERTVQGVGKMSFGNIVIIILMGLSFNLVINKIKSLEGNQVYIIKMLEKEDGKDDNTN